MPAARVSDSLVCFGGPPDSISQGEPTVIIGGQPAARLGDGTSHGGVIVAGCPTVIIGSSPQAQTLILAAQAGTPFCEECEKRKAQAASAPAAPPASGAAAAIANVAASQQPTRERIQQEIQRKVSRTAAAVDRWLRHSPHRLAARYRKSSQQKSNFAELIRGRIIDIRMRQWLRKKYGKMPGARIDQTVPGSGSKLRPDLYLPDVDGEKVIYEIGGKTKRADKYKGLADSIRVIHTRPNP
jgi:hypothetical protein